MYDFREQVLITIKTNLFMLGSMTVVNLAWLDLINDPMFVSSTNTISFGFPVIFLAHIIVALFISSLDIFNHDNANRLTLVFWLISFAVFFINPDALSLIASAGFIFRVSYHANQAGILNDFQAIVEKEIEIAKR